MEDGEVVRHFFVRQTKMVINALNPSSTIDEETKAKATVRLPFSKNDEENENYSIAVYYDAWENDNDTEPVLSLIYEITKQLSVDFFIVRYKCCQNSRSNY